MRRLLGEQRIHVALDAIQRAQLRRRVSQEGVPIEGGRLSWRRVKIDACVEPRGLNREMRYYEIIAESLSPRLYHNTTLRAAAEILRNGFFYPRDNWIMVQDQSYKGVSTTRSPHMAYIDRETPKDDELFSTPSYDGIKAVPVTFVLDRNAVAQRCKIVPVDFYRDRRRDADKIYGVPRSEAEEVIHLEDKVLPLKGNVVKIIIDTSRGRPSPDFLARAAELGIPVVATKFRHFAWPKRRELNKHAYQTMKQEAGSLVKNVPDYPSRSA